MSDKHEGLITVLGLLAFVAICLFASWFGERIHNPEDYYGGNGSYLEETCPDCNVP